MNLIKEKKNKAFYKVLKVIKSCKTDEHIEGVYKMTKSFYRMFGDSELYVQLVNEIHRKNLSIIGLEYKVVLDRKKEHSRINHIKNETPPLIEVSDTNKWKRIEIK